MSRYSGARRVDRGFSMEHAMRAVMRTVASVLVFVGFGIGPLAAQANPPPGVNPSPSNPPPQNQPATQAPPYSSNEIIDTGHRFFGAVSSGLATIVEKT